MKLKRKLVKLINFWPPFLGAGIKVKKVSEDLRSIDVQMTLSRFNSNYVGTHYGGSLYSMTDPFYMLMLIENLGREYIVWDKAASIKFKKPGKGTVHAHFHLEESTLQEIRAKTESGEKFEPIFKVFIRDQHSEVVAEVEKKLYIKKKPQNSK